MLILGEIIGHCSCGRNEKVQFYCWEKNCPNRATQQYYCARCNEDRPSKHNHNAKQITMSLPLINQGWLEFHNTANETLKIAEAVFLKHKNLIDLLESKVSNRNDVTKLPS